MVPIWGSILYNETNYLRRGITPKSISLYLNAALYYKYLLTDKEQTKYQKSQIERF